MLAISVELLHGTIRATGADDTSITGAVDAGEWPPSPARVFSALVAADGTGTRQHVTDGSELLLLERAAPPRIVADRLDAVLRSSLRERFVVKDGSYVHNKTRHTSAVQEYVGRTAVLVRPGTRLAPISPNVVYMWDDLDVDDRTLRALSLRAARVGYLGCSDSPVRVSVSTTPVHRQGAWTPHDEGRVILPVPYDGFLGVLDDAFARTERGEEVRRAWVPNRYVRYRSPGWDQRRPPQGTSLWLRFDPSVSGRRLLAVTESLRAAVLERYSVDVIGGGDEVPGVLHGHGFEGRGHHQAHFLALPDVGHHHARGRLHGAAIALPPATPPDVVEGVRTALWRIKTLAKRGVFETGVRPHGGEKGPLAAAPSRWKGPSRRWVSATPVVHERFQRRGPDLEEVQRWCDHAAVAAHVVRFRVSRVPIIEGALSLHPSEVHRDQGEGRPYSHLEIVLDDAVRGPLAVGRARQFGFGLMLPVGWSERPHA